MKTLFPALALFLAIAAPAFADRIILESGDSGERPGWSCEQEEKASVDLRLNFTTRDIANLHADMDKREKEILGMAEKAGLTTIELKSSNYSANANRRNRDEGDDAAPQYRVSGNMRFDVVPAEKAGSFVGQLGDKGYDATLRVQSRDKCRPDADGRLK